MAKNTRLATTVTARYLSGAGAVDAFYLDGRMNGKREEYFADITLDREDRGSFYAVYASSHGSTLPLDGSDGNHAQLARISKELKENSRANIDSSINELAETAVGVAGRLMLSDTTTIQPYFAGVIVKDGELAAVTLGRACAYLYRDDALFPLTQDDLAFEAVDYYGKSLPNMGDFSAGVAGSLRYSNIAQLKANDCIILCNKEVMEIIGQRRMLQILDQSEDQCDAAGQVMGLATHEVEQGSLQFMIAFVEDIVPLDRLGRSTLARGFANLSRATGLTKAVAAPPPKASRATGRTEFAQAVNTEDLFANFAPTAAAAAPVQKREAPGPNAGSGVAAATTAAVVASQAAAPPPPAAPAPQARTPEQEPAPVAVSDLIADLESEEDILANAPSGVHDIVDHIAKAEEEGQPLPAAELSDEDRQAVNEALEREGVNLDAAFEETEIGDAPAAAAGEAGELLEETRARGAERRPLPAGRKAQAQRGHFDELERRGDGGGIRKLAMVVLLAVAGLLLAFIIYTLAFGDSGSSGATTSGSTLSTMSVETLPTNTAAPVVVSSTTESSAAESSAAAQPGGEYTVKSGDTLLGIIRSAYSVSEGEAYDLIDMVLEANPGLDIDNLQLGQVLTLPPLGGETTESAEP